MTQSARSWRFGLLLTGMAWLTTLALLTLGVVRFEIMRPTGIVGLSFWLALVAGFLAVAAAWFALRGLRRQHLMEADLRRSQQTFQGILTIAAEAIVTVDEDHRVTQFNHAAEALFGYPANEIIGEHLTRLIPARYRERHAGHMAGYAMGPGIARRMGDRRPIHGLRRDGTEFAAEASISRLQIDGGQLFCIVMRDISERLDAEGRQAFLMRAGAALSTSLDADLTLTAATHAGVPYLADCAILDVIEAQHDVRRVVSVHDDAEVTRALRGLAGRRAELSSGTIPAAEAVASGAPVLIDPLPETWCRDLHEDTGVLVSTVQPRALLTLPLMARGQPIGALTLISTDPERVFGAPELEVARALAERVSVALDNARLYQESQRASQARDELLGVVSHDLRNPLSAISMCARVLAEMPPEDPAQRHELYSSILDAVAMMQRLIQDLLDVATIESGHLKVAPEPGEPALVVQRALAMVTEAANERGITLTSTVPGHLPRVRMDSMRIEQVIANLLANAVKFTDRGGTVALDVTADDRALEVTVRDTGIGIPAESLPRIFDRFWHARRSGRTAGTGLGLAIAKGIVNAHGGAIDVASTVGTGSTFTFRIPLHGPESTSHGRPVARLTVEAGNGHPAASDVTRRRSEASPTVTESGT